MSDIKLDLKNFKYHGSDDKSTTLTHTKQGHKLTLYHNVLSPKNKDILKALAKVPVKEANGGNIHKELSPSETQMMAEGGPSDRYASNPEKPKDARDLTVPHNTIVDKTTPEQDKSRNAASDQAESNYKAANSHLDKPAAPAENQAQLDAKGGMIKSCYACGGKVHYAEGDEVKQTDEQGRPSDMPSMPDSPPNVERQALSDAMANSDESTPDPDMPPGGYIAPQPAPDQDPSLDKEIADESNKMMPADQGQPQAQAPSETIPTEAPVDHKTATKQELDKEAMAWQQDLANGHIEPKTYSSLFHDKSTLGKIGTIFGMLLSGAGSGLAHQQNAMLQMMDKQISNDLEAQKQSKTNAQNFLKLNQENELKKAQQKQIEAGIPLTAAQVELTKADANQKAYALTQNQMLQSTFHDMVSNVNKMPEGPQKDAARQQLAIIQGQIGNKINNVNDSAAGASAYYNQLFGQAKPGNKTSDEQSFQQRVNGMKMLGPEGQARAQDIESKHFPGMEGQASVPLSGADREELNSGITFDQKLNRFIDWTKNHSGALNPKDFQTGKAMAAELQGAYRMATHGGVYKEGEQNFISKIIDEDPTKFFNKIRVLPQLNAVSKENKLKVDQKAKSLGFPGYSPKSSAASQVNEGTTGTHNGRPTIFKNGKWEYK